MYLRVNKIYVQFNSHIEQYVYVYVCTGYVYLCVNTQRYCYNMFTDVRWWTWDLKCGCSCIPTVNSILILSKSFFKISVSHLFRRMPRTTLRSLLLITEIHSFTKLYVYKQFARPSAYYYVVCMGACLCVYRLGLYMCYIRSLKYIRVCTCVCVFMCDYVCVIVCSEFVIDSCMMLMIF